MNALRLAATIVERDALRYTPAGVPVIECRLQHEGGVLEGGMHRQVEFEAFAKAIGEASQLVLAAPLGVKLEIRGFLARRSRQSRSLVIHITGLKALESV